MRVAALGCVFVVEETALTVPGVRILGARLEMGGSRRRGYQVREGEPSQLHVWIKVEKCCLWKFDDRVKRG